MLKKPSRFMLALNKAFTWPRLFGFSFIAMVITCPGFSEYLEYHSFWLEKGIVDSSYLYGVIDTMLFLSFIGLIKAVVMFCSDFVKSAPDQEVPK